MKRARDEKGMEGGEGKEKKRRRVEFRGSLRH